eukprot:CAMPEP_0113474222 /NCGR_PEP_ID=MMETSP0014_2-20120614/18466_1 /TAXON_ID=2857 /ORGANISM="Nitzschia sp." /LENGTH=282 /DNA_ID=CAMNT_0000367049 /DNA_START=57 /DNA_END=905 /DNA_ORIENTATION=- /assembly_acc=CAM_ASM_000159
MVCQSPLRLQSSTRSIANLYNTSSSGFGAAVGSDGLFVVQSPSFGGPIKKRMKTRRRRASSTRGVVTIDLDSNQIQEIPSLDDYTEEEHTATFYTRDEYSQMKSVIRQTVNYLKTPPPSPTSPQQQFQNQRGGTATSNNNNNNNGVPSSDVVETDGTVCVRGLECLVDDFVGSHRKRVRTMSQSAVFEYQHMVKYHQQQQQQQLQDQPSFNLCQEDQDGDCSMMLSSSPLVEDDSTTAAAASTATAAAAAEGIAQAYIYYTNGCQSIAEKWGHFDAIDAAYL